MGKHVGPTPVAQKRRHDSILLHLTGGCRQAKWKDMGGLSAKDKLTNQELYLSPPGGGFELVTSAP
jgi:hypothetical protein